MINPFTPSFGDLPPELIGRKGVLRDITEALLGPITDPFRAVLFTGARGTGKTVMLGEISDIGLKNGYIVVNVTAGKNLALDILNQLSERSNHLLDKKSRKVSGMNIGKFGITYVDEKQEELGFRTRLERLVEAINEKGSGVLITVDEVYKYAPGLEELSTAFQHFKQEKRNVALMLAGLPKNISDILEEDENIRNLTFLRRAIRETLGNVDIDQIEKGYDDIITPITGKVDKSIYG
ncbi:MAG: ATP-binding protein [Candidatus Ancillula sp.]|nr:ATP-binding protein [Candidatus Ancillula sp.]